jgi:hypothetical protein
VWAFEEMPPSGEKAITVSKKIRLRNIKEIVCDQLRVKPKAIAQWRLVDS